MESFDVSLLSTNGLLALAALAVVPALIAYVALRVAKYPKAGGWSLAIGGVGVPVLAVIAWQLVGTQVRLGEDGLHVDGGLYHVAVPYADIDVARIVVGGRADLPSLRLRTNGIGLPGAALGWFRTADRTVFAAYSGADGSVYIPTRRAHDLMLSPDDAERLVRELSRREAPGSE